MATKPPAHIGTVTSLALDGAPVSEIFFELVGPVGDRHASITRYLSGHDGDYIRTSDLGKGALVFNWRSWTGLSSEEVTGIEKAINHAIPVGCLLENMTISGIPDFSQLEPTSRLVFPAHTVNGVTMQTVLAVWEENGPCATVAKRLEDHHQTPGLKTDFIRAAQHKRGIMGFVLSAGSVKIGDHVHVYPPVR
jgi:hypothetical protein